MSSCTLLRGTLDRLMRQCNPLPQGAAVPERWPGLTGDPSLVRISASGGRADPCLEQQAAKARPALRPARRSRARKPRLNDFPLGPVMAALDAVELCGQPIAEAVAGLGSEGSRCIRE